MSALALAEIVEEGEQLEKTYRETKPFTAAEIGASDALHAFYVEHGPRLLAVAKAAVEMRDAEQAYSVEGDRGGPAAWRLFRAKQVIDAAVRGAK